MIQNLYTDLKKAPFFNSLLLLTVLSLQAGRGLFYFFLSLILLYFLADFFRHWKAGLGQIKSITTDLKQVLIAFLLIFISMALSNLINDYSNVTAWTYQIKFFLKIPILLLILLYFYRKDYFSKPLLYAFILSSIFIHALDGIYQAIYGYDYFRGTVRTLCDGLTGITKNRNDFGFLIGFGIFLTLGLIFNTRNNAEKWIYSLCGMILMFCLLYSLSRAAWLAVLVSLSFLLIYNLLRSDFKHSLFTLFFITILVASSFSVDCLSARTTNLIESTSLVEESNLTEPARLAGTTSSNKSKLGNVTTSSDDHTHAAGSINLADGTHLITADFSTYERLQIWNAIAEMIAQKPIFGWGMEKIYQFGRFSNHTHNVALEIALHTGLVGLMAFIYCLYQVFNAVISNKQMILFSILLYLIIKCLFDHTLFSGIFVPASLAAILFFTFSEKIKRL